MNAPKKITLNQFDYSLPLNLIGQTPIKPRDQARLLILDKATGHLSHKKFYQLADYFKAGDVLVLNNSRVIPARLGGHKITGGAIEIFLLKKVSKNKWQVLIGGKIKVGQKVYLKNKIEAKIIKKLDDHSWLIKFNAGDKKILEIGQAPLPPYIKKPAQLPDYQTVYAKIAGSVAAPTAGLHFTKNLLKKLKQRGVIIKYVTLHVGRGTFEVVKSHYIQDHKMHSEWASLDKATAQILNRARVEQRQIVAVGTTTLRTLEAFADKNGKLKPQSGWLNIFIYPGYQFKFVDKLITNFHLPKSTLLMLVSALAGSQLIKKTYQTAINKKYKFFSFGDAMFIK